MTKKKKIIALLSAAVLALTALGVSFAWYYTHDAVTNSLKTAQVDVELQEILWEDANGEELRIGDTVDKNPTVTANNGDIYFEVDMTITDKNGTEITDETVLSYLESFLYYDPDDKLESGVSYTQDEIDALGLEHFNSAFQREGDTFIYKTDSGYTRLADGESAVLFTKICVPADITKSDWTATMSPLESCTISFKVRAVLADGFDDGTDAEIANALVN